MRSVRIHSYHFPGNPRRQNSYENHHLKISSLRENHFKEMRFNDSMFGLNSHDAGRSVWKRKAEKSILWESVLLNLPHISSLLCSISFLNL